MIYSENILICILIPLMISLIFVRGNTRRFILAFSLGMIICLLAAYISGFINLAGNMGRNDSAIYISPVVEEIMKILPVLFCLFIFRAGNETLIIFSVGLGCGFATFENCCYILTEGAGRFTYILIRGMAVGVMHVVCILTMTMGIIVARRFKVLSLPCILGALSMSITFHGLYNLLVSAPGISSYIGYALPLVTAAVIYIPYRKLKLL